MQFEPNANYLLRGVLAVVGAANDSTLSSTCT